MMDMRHSPNGPSFAGRLIAVSGGFLGPSAQAQRIRRILQLAHSKPRLGIPSESDPVLAWGHSPRAWRAEALAQRFGAPIWRIEDAFIRSIHPGRVAGEPPVGLLLDRQRMHYDPSGPSDLEDILAQDPFDDHTLIARARDCLRRLRDLELSKYNATDPTLPPPTPGYVLIIDQVRGDASLTHGGLTDTVPDRVFRDMLAAAQDENPGARILIRAHPESRNGERPGYFSAADVGGPVEFIDGAYSPWQLFDGAIAVYTVSSQVGFEAILAGHKPRVFGLPFYAGWGLSAEERQVARRGRKLTRTQLFAGAMLRYPIWYDPYSDALCGLETVLDHMEAQVRCWREDHQGYVALGLRLWKRKPLQGFYGRHTPLVFAKNGSETQASLDQPARKVMAWASNAPSGFDGVRIEDGFLRSAGLGAELTPPQSLVADSVGIYYDPTRPSHFEILMSQPLNDAQRERAQDLRDKIKSARVTKYNLAGRDRPELARLERLKADHPDRAVILVPGQVEDDASIRLGTVDIRTNRALLEAARHANPDALVVYKPHPDVEAGLRPGTVNDADTLCDVVLTKTDAATALDHCDAVWTMTSGLGFEALLRDIPVTCLGVPFYAGWGLSTDLAAPPSRRIAPPRAEALDRLTHAALIAYPRYVDPVTYLPCPPEVIVDRMATRNLGRAPRTLKALAKAQGALASYAWAWRGKR